MRIAIFCLCCLGVFLSACTQEAPNESAPRSIAAQTIRLARMQAQECRSLSGQVRSRNSVVLASKISGTVTEVAAQEGSVVEAGQTIVRIDDAELRQREQSIGATAGQAKLERQALAARRTLAQATLDRMRSLLKSNAVSRDEVDRAQAEYDALVSQEKAVGAQVTAVQFQGAEVRSLLRYSTVSSPTHGVLTRRFVDLGAFVQAGSPVAEVVEDLQRGFDLEAQADESMLGQVHLGMSVVAVIPAVGSGPFLTTVNAVVGQVDPASRSFRIKASVEGSVRAGMFGALYVPMAETEKLLVPLSCLRPRGELMTALIVDEQDVLRLRLLKIGAHYQKADVDGRTFIVHAGMDQLGPNAQATPGAELLVEVLSGLFPGEEVVLAAPDVAREGDRLVRR